MFAMMYILGAQAGELFRARRSDYVRELQAAIHLPGRGGGRTLPLVPLLADLLEEYLADFSALPGDGPLFPGVHGGWLSDSGELNLELSERASALGIGFRVRTLDLREACKAHMRERGIHRLTLQALLGGETPDETPLFGHKRRLRATGS
jgi:integrase